VHDRVEVPEPAMLVGVRVHDRLVELLATDRVTVPVKLLRAPTVTFDVPATPALVVMLVGLEEIVKS
jgi:hypothetical protein